MLNLNTDWMYTFFHFTFYSNSLSFFSYFKIWLLLDAVNGAASGDWWKTEYPFRKIHGEAIFQHLGKLAAPSNEERKKKLSFLHIIYFYSRSPFRFVSYHHQPQRQPPEQHAFWPKLHLCSEAKKKRHEIKLCQWVCTRIISSILKFPFVHKIFKIFAYFLPLFKMNAKKRLSRNLCRVGSVNR